MLSLPQAETHQSLVSWTVLTPVLARKWGQDRGIPLLPSQLPHSSPLIQHTQTHSAPRTHIHLLVYTPCVMWTFKALQASVA